MSEFEDKEMFGQDDDRERVNADKTSELSQGLQMNTDDRDPNLETRPPRISMAHGFNIAFEDVEFDRVNFRYYAFIDRKDKPGRIESAKGDYWEHVKNIHGSIATRPAGSDTYFLMRLPMKYAKEDLELKKAKVARTMADAGKLKPGEYAPDAKTGKAEGGDSIHQSSYVSDSPIR